MIASAAISKAQSYIDAVLSGDQVTGELVHAAVQRHADDLQRQSTPGFPFHFDAHHAAAAVDFFPTVLCHSIGDFAGMPFELEPWQVFAIANIFGWKRDDDNSRRFRKVYWSMARKNGKSSVAAGLALFLASLDVNPHTGRPEDVAEVILSATKKEQVEKVIYAEIERMRIRSPYIERNSSRENKQITFRHNSGSIRCVGSDKPYDGLNPHVVIMDELHAWREHHRKFYDTMQTGSGYRRQPLIVTITTAGDDRSFIWLDEYKYAKGVARGEIKDESLFSYCFEMDEDDDPLDETLWVKANPNLHVSVKEDFLQQQARPARESKLALNRFTRYHGNRLVGSNEQAFDLNLWDTCSGTLSDWREADAIGGGIDLGGRDDLAAWALVARFPVDLSDEKNPIWRYEIKTQSYIASSTERDLSKQPFADWVHTGQLRKTPHPINELKADFVEQCRVAGVRDVAYDPYNGQQFAEDIEREGITIARMAQNYSMFNEPIGDFMQSIKDGLVVHDGSPLLRWCIGNAVLVRDRQDRWMYDKRESSDKIDPVVAVTMAYRRAMVAPKRVSGSYFIG